MGEVRSQARSGSLLRCINHKALIPISIEEISKNNSRLLYHCCNPKP